MATMTMRLDETDAAIVRKFAEFEEKAISNFVRDAVFEKIEDQQDLATLHKAIASTCTDRSPLTPPPAHQRPRMDAARTQRTPASS